MTPVEQVKALVTAKALVFRRAGSVHGRTSLLHAVPLSSSVAICGYLPAGLWGDEAAANDGSGRCSLCVRQLQRAGYGVSWANVIVAEARANA